MKRLPKRRKYKDNPYKIEQLNENKYSVTFKDNKNTTHIVHISQEIYMALNEFELIELSQLNEFDRHI